jgi:hypothetical protein
MSSIVQFNRKFTQAQLTAAEGSGTINDGVNNVAVINGCWYIASSLATRLYVGSLEGGSGAVLKRVADITDFSGLDGSVSKSASGASDAASSRTSSVQVVGGFTIAETDGVLDGNGSSVTSVKADMAGAADKAYDDAKTYADGLITALGTVMHFEGVIDTEANLKSTVTTPKKGDVWVVTADSSEWVYTGDSVDATHPYDSTKWQKFGTTDVNGALYKGSNALTNETFVVTDGVNGQMKAISDADIATRLNYKTKQTAVPDPAASGTATTAITSISQDTNGVVTVSKANIPSGTGSVGTASAASDAWKTVVHDTSLSGHTLSGNTVAIPAATGQTGGAGGNDGYMTVQQATNLNTAILALTWDE